MKDVLKYLLGIGLIIWCIFSPNIDCSLLLRLLLSLVLFVLFIGGGIYAVAYALGKISKYRGEANKEELNCITEPEKQIKC
jgi:hypothetical protein